MHRTEGEDYDNDLYGNGTNKRGYKPESAPSADDGTRLPAEAMNAIQEELCNLLEAVGIAPNTTAAADKAAGWNQLYTAIFNSQKLTAAALAANAITTAKIANSVITGEKIDSAALVAPLKKATTGTKPIYLELADGLEVSSGALRAIGIYSGTNDKPVKYLELGLSTPQLVSGSSVYQTRGQLNLLINDFDIIGYSVTSGGRFGTKTVFLPNLSTMSGYNLQLSNHTEPNGVATDKYSVVLDFDVAQSIQRFSSDAG